MRIGMAMAVVLLCGACQSAPQESERAAPDLFVPTSMRIHPIFTDIKDWTGDGEPDGVEVLIEFRDQFGDLTKSAGTAVFELYEYRPYNPDVRGERVANPWIGSLQTAAEQGARWNSISRTYMFRLQAPNISGDRGYVLAASFKPLGRERFFDQIVLEPSEQRMPGDPSAATRPAAP